METLEVLKVALCQHDIVWENAPATIARLDAPVRSFCAQHPTDILVLPETFSVGFTMNHAVAEPEDGPSATWLRRIASECGVAVIASVPTRWTGPDGASHITNRCRFIEPDGTEVFYDKHHLFTPSGEYRAVVDVVAAAAVDVDVDVTRHGGQAAAVDPLIRFFRQVGPVFGKYTRNLRPVQQEGAVAEESGSGVDVDVADISLHN